MHEALGSTPSNTTRRCVCGYPFKTPKLLGFLISGEKGYVNRWHFYSSNSLQRLAKGFYQLLLTRSMYLLSQPKALEFNRTIDAKHRISFQKLTKEQIHFSFSCTVFPLKNKSIPIIQVANYTLSLLKGTNYLVLI